MKRKLFCLIILSIFASLTQLSARCRDDACHCTRANWDYIIVGNGTAGAVLARQLSDGNQNRVLVLEWGENRTTDPAVLSPDSFAYSNTLTYDPLYAINDIVRLTFPNMAPQFFIYSDGRMWGGGSASNAMFAVRGTPRVYNEWAAISGNPQWSYNNILPYFLAAEHYTPNGTIANPAQRGLSGTLFITQKPPVNTDPIAIAESNATGAPLVSDYNDPSLGDTGVSAHQQFTTPEPNAQRSFSISAFLPVGGVVDEDGFGLDGRKLRIVSNALVNRVVFKNKRATGVEYYLDGNANRAIYVKANKKVILCAGGPRTPGILERSGIGNGNLLRSLGIDVVVDNPNVGEHLINHYGAIGVITGSTTSSSFIHAYTDNRPYEPADNVRRVQYLTFNIPGGINIGADLMAPKSRGSVHIIDTNPTVYPRIDLNMYSDGSVTTPGTDAYNVVSFLKILQTIASNAGQTVLSPAPSVYSGGDSALLAYAQTLSNMFIAYHIVGTARMGQSINDAVVGGDLHVFGVKGLMIADTSIEPTIQDGNTAYAAYFIPMVAAKIIKNEHHDH